MKENNLARLTGGRAIYIYFSIDCNESQRNYYVSSLWDWIVSPGDTHFRMYDGVTDNCILDLQGKISIRSAFVPLLLVFSVTPSKIDTSPESGK